MEQISWDYINSNIAKLYCSSEGESQQYQLFMPEKNLLSTLDKL
jgi:hypothetical protein